MSIRKTLPALGALVFLGLGAVACESPEQKAEKAANAQAEADKRASDVAAEIDRKEEAISRKATQEMGKVEREGEAKVAEAQRKADRKSDEAVDALWQARTDARVALSKRLDDIDQRIVDARPDIEKAQGLHDSQVTMDSLRARAASARADMETLGTASSDDMGRIRKGIEARLDDLKTSIRDATKRR